jgi:hypothetical protein
VKGGLEPLVQIFSSTISQHLCTLLEQSIEAMYLGMDLAELLECQPFLVRQIGSAAEHQSNGYAWRPLERWGSFADLDALLLHSTQTEKKPLTSHA